jgi:hypothetical protein
LVLVVAGTSKAIFAVLVLSHGGRFLSHQAGIAVAVDLMWVGVFTSYLVASRAARAARIDAAPLV